MSDEQEVKTAIKDEDEKEEEGREIDPDLILGDDAAVEEDAEEDAAIKGEEDEETLDESDINPFGDKWEE
jgi:hypothetical protein